MVSFSLTFGRLGINGINVTLIWRQRQRRYVLSSLLDVLVVVPRARKNITMDTASTFLADIRLVFRAVPAIAGVVDAAPPAMERDRQLSYTTFIAIPPRTLTG